MEPNQGVNLVVIFREGGFFFLSPSPFFSFFSPFFLFLLFLGACAVSISYEARAQPPLEPACKLVRPTSSVGLLVLLALLVIMPSPCRVMCWLLSNRSRQDFENEGFLAPGQEGP